jgi:hypothetical protein
LNRFKHDAGAVAAGLLGIPPHCLLRRHARAAHRGKNGAAGLRDPAAAIGEVFTLGERL